MRAVIVCVEYSDLLDITLPYNRHHFDDVLVVTSLADVDTCIVASKHGAHVFTTDAFYDDGADFNKWKALEQGLDHFGRTGWLCLIDADIVWPRELHNDCYEWVRDGWVKRNYDGLCDRQFLYTPRCRVCEDTSRGIPDEREWINYPLRRNPGEFAGYTQIFHATDPALPARPPWHETDWRHAGGADSTFQARWSADNKIRPAFQALHLGATGQNWCGRATPYVDGTQHPQSAERRTKLRTYLINRAQRTGPLQERTIEERL